MDVSIPKFQHKMVCRTEYGTLQKVVLCSPEHMTIKDVINETQKHFEDDNIHVKPPTISTTASLKHLGHIMLRSSFYPFATGSQNRFSLGI